MLARENLLIIIIYSIHKCLSVFMVSFLIIWRNSGKVNLQFDFITGCKMHLPVSLSWTRHFRFASRGRGRKLTFVSVKRGRPNLPKILYKSREKTDWLLRFGGFFNVFERELEPKWLVSFVESLPCVCVCSMKLLFLSTGGGEAPKRQRFQYSSRLRPKPTLYP